MKKTLLLLCLLFVKGAAFCQLTISGHITGVNKADSVEVNLPFSGYTFKYNSYIGRPNAKGNFKITIPQNTPALVTFMFRQKGQLLLLSARRPLIININGSKNAYTFAGIAKTENALLKKLKVDDPDSLSFVKEAKKSKNISYVTWSMDSVFRIKLPAIRHSLDSTEQIVKAALIPQPIKTIIHDEVTFCYAYGVANNLGGWLNTRKNALEFNTRFIDTVWASFRIPTQKQLNSGISSNLYLEQYFRFKFWKAYYIYKTAKDKDQASIAFKNTLGVSMDDMKKNPDRYNERYMDATLFKKVLPEYAWEKLLANELDVFCSQSQLMASDKMLNFIKINTPDNPYLPYCEKTIAPMKKQREKYASNLDIKIRPDYRNASSLKQLLEPYKGKVVLVDMWGTWCPHCIEDMAFEPALKKRFENKDVVFLYLANDEDKDDEKWRDFIFINDLTGQHIRRTKEQTAPLWNELGIKDNDQAYPHYFIVGKQGNVLVKDAKRPGTDNGLYDQLESALNGK
jgi:thiol-disulfide isomerase/thioredoxin